MKRGSSIQRFGKVAVLGVVLVLACEAPAFACAACFGKSDSAMARSLNASIFTLMGCIATVLVGAASFFVFIARRAGAGKAEATTNPPAQPSS